MVKSSLFDYSNAYILVQGTITIIGKRTDTATRQVDERGKEVIFKNCALFTDYVSKINNTQVDNAKDLNVVMLMCNLIECSNNYAKISGTFVNITEMSQMLL